MKEPSAVAGKLIPVALNKRAVNNNKGPAKAGEECNQSQQVERAPTHRDKSPPRKKKPPHRPSTSEAATAFEATTAGASIEVSKLFAKFAEVLRERAAADTTQMKELDGILAEARNLQFHLKERKRHLRQRLALISDKLQG